MWMVRPPMAASVCSRKPLSLSVSVCSWTWMSASSATFRQQSMAAGIEPQSSWSFMPATPPSIWSISDFGLYEFPRPRKAKLIGHCSTACSILPTFKAPPQSMPTVIGPSEPPIIVVMPELMACSHSGAVEMHVHVDAARRRDQAFAVAHRRRRPADQRRMDAVHDRRVAGFADGDDAAVLDAEIALDDAEHRIDQHGIAQQHVERAGGAVVAGGEPHAVTQGLAAAV